MCSTMDVGREGIRNIGPSLERERGTPPAPTYEVKKKEKRKKKKEKKRKEKKKKKKKRGQFDNIGRQDERMEAQPHAAFRFQPLDIYLPTYPPTKLRHICIRAAPQSAHGSAHGSARTLLDDVRPISARVWRTYMYYIVHTLHRRPAPGTARRMERSDWNKTRHGQPSGCGAVACGGGAVPPAFLPSFHFLLFCRHVTSDDLQPIPPAPPVAGDETSRVGRAWGCPWRRGSASAVIGVTIIVTTTTTNINSFLLNPAARTRPGTGSRRQVGCTLLSSLPHMAGWGGTTCGESWSTASFVRAAHKRI